MKKNLEILDGKKVADQRAILIRKKLEKLSFIPKVAIIQVGSEFATNHYIKAKLKVAKNLGIEIKHLKFLATISQSQLINQIKKVIPIFDGLIIQLPLPQKIDPQTILNQIPYDKDIDGLASNNPYVYPATALAVFNLLNFYQIEIINKVVVVVGQGLLAGKPISDLCQQQGAEVIRLDKNTSLNSTQKADILIVATGEKNLIKARDIKEGAIVIDIGINYETKKDQTKIVGDVDLKSIVQKAKAYTPVPGGVGPMTVISLFENLLTLLKVRAKK